MSAAPETVLAGRYRMIRALGRGAFARTFLAEDAERARPAAIKVLDPAQAADLKAFELFEREARVLRTLRHQGVPEVFEAFRADWNGAPVHCLAMEYIEGESLAALIESGQRLDRAEVMRLFAEIVGVLDYLHTRVPAVLHRDIKPANIVVRPDGSPALVDFGSVAAVHRPDGGSTVAGTYGYMPYEQYMGQATPASDLYALAATFLHLITGSSPPTFMTDTGRLAVPASIPCGEPLAGILRRLLEPAPTDRIQSAAEVRASLFGASLPAIPERPGSALAATGSGQLHPVAIDLPPVPRRITGSLRDLYRRVAPGTWRMLNATDKPSRFPDLGSIVLVGFFSLITMGILPAWFWSISYGKRRRAKPFLRDGILAEATVLGMELEDIGFNEKLVRVRYQFQADGRTIRASDTILHSVAERWQVGERVHVLYLPEADYDSLIVS